MSPGNFLFLLKMQTFSTNGQILQMVQWDQGLNFKGAQGSFNSISNSKSNYTSHFVWGRKHLITAWSGTGCQNLSPGPRPAALLRDRHTALPGQAGSAPLKGCAPLPLLLPFPRGNPTPNRSRMVSVWVERIHLPRPVPSAGPGRGQGGTSSIPDPHAFIHSGGEAPQSRRPPFDWPPPPPQPFSHQTLKASLSAIVRAGISRRSSLLPTRSQWPSGESGLEPGQPSPPPLLLDSQPMGSGPIETSISGQSRLQPARSSLAAEHAAQNSRGEKAREGPWPPGSRLTSYFVSTAHSPRGIGDHAQGFSQPREPSSKTGPSPRASPEPSPGPARPPTESEWPASHRDSVSSWQTLAKLKRERKGPPPPMGGRWPFVTGWKFLLSGMSP